jgi:hypothetical protein
LKTRALFILNDISSVRPFGPLGERKKVAQNEKNYTYFISKIGILAHKMSWLNLGDGTKILTGKGIWHKTSEDWVRRGLKPPG